MAACIKLGMPNNAGQMLHNNSILRSKVNNLCSSLTYSRSGIPIKSGIQTRLSQSFPSSASKPDVACLKPVDDNDNVIHSGNTDSTERSNSEVLLNNSASSLVKPKKFATSEHNFTESAKNGLSAFESKCLNICKKYPALSQKSSFKKPENSTNLSQSAGDTISGINEDAFQRMSSSTGCKLLFHYISCISYFTITVPHKLFFFLNVCIYI